SYFVNRLTPTNYPSTVTKVAIFFQNASFSPTSGTSFDVIVGANPSGGASIDGAKFTVTPATVESGSNTFAIYNAPPMTITSGDFTARSRIRCVTGVFTAANYTSPPPQNRSYFSPDGFTFAQSARNSAFRAATFQGCPSTTNVNPTAGPASTPVTIT